MTTLLEQVVKDLRALSREEEDRATCTFRLVDMFNGSSAGWTTDLALRRVLSSLST